MHGKALAKARTAVTAGKDDSLLGSLFSDSPATATAKAGVAIDKAAASVAAAKTAAAAASAATDTALETVSDAGKAVDATDAGFDVSLNDRLEDVKGVVIKASKIQTSAGESLLATRERINALEAQTKSLADELASLKAAADMTAKAESDKAAVIPMPVPVVEPAAEPAKPVVAEAPAPAPVPVVADKSAELDAAKAKVATLEARLAAADKEKAALKEQVAELETQVEQAKDFVANATKPRRGRAVAKPATKGVFARYKALREQLASGRNHPRRVYCGGRQPRQINRFRWIENRPFAGRFFIRPTRLPKQCAARKHTMSETLRRTPLFDFHVRNGARMVPFAGWEMPVQYSSVIEEHNAVRTKAACSTSSHMGECRVTGPDAARFLDRVMTNVMATIRPGAARYTVMCQPDGGCVDDLIVYRVSEHEFFICLNAGNAKKDIAWMREQAKSEGFDVTVGDECADWAQLAAQGPLAEKIVAKLTTADLTAIKRFAFYVATVAGVRA